MAVPNVMKESKMQTEMACITTKAKQLAMSKRLLKKLTKIIEKQDHG